MYVLTTYLFGFIRLQKPWPIVLNTATKLVSMWLWRLCGDSGKETENRVSRSSCALREFVAWKGSCAPIWRPHCEQEGPRSLGAAAPVVAAAKSNDEKNSECSENSSILRDLADESRGTIRFRTECPGAL